jgi:hypothetical protein
MSIEDTSIAEQMMFDTISSDSSMVWERRLYAYITIEG